MVHNRHNITITCYRTTIVVILLSSVLCNDTEDHTRAIRHKHKHEDDDYDLEDDWDLDDEEDVQEIGEHMSDYITIWPYAGMNPSCPPPILHHINPALCDLPNCEVDIDCDQVSSGAGENETNIQQVCCYNGCIHTCTNKLDPPIAIDMLEVAQTYMEAKSDVLLGMGEEISVPEQLEHAKVVPLAVALPGGCIITAKQYKELEDFKKHSYVNKCFCNRGDVSCDVS